ncbi:hypothetical protein PVAP13_3NG052064 [Panicum virgatum]|uniref:Uncharacterized protein n=1 Tax=Panicum virgatum TaxID=38727 RepID=A0A8T0TUK0_PANVG|nr:hypothetical protein PVAP13_3NG052064 [Panicum virgatum]
MSRHLVVTLLQRKEAYKRLIRDRFRPLREIAITIEEEELEDEQMDCIKNFHHSLALKLETACNKVVHVLHTCLVPCPSSRETVVYHKICILVTVYAQDRGREDKLC